MLIFIFAVGTFFYDRTLVNTGQLSMPIFSFLLLLLFKIPCITGLRKVKIPPLINPINSVIYIWQQQQKVLKLRQILSIISYQSQSLWVVGWTLWCGVLLSPHHLFYSYFFSPLFVFSLVNSLYILFLCNFWHLFNFRTVLFKALWRKVSQIF